MPHLKPFLLVPSLLTERWDAEITIPLIKPETPVLLLAGQKDELVLPVQMRGIKALREKAGGKVKWVEFPNGTHSTLIYDISYRYIAKPRGLRSRRHLHAAWILGCYYRLFIGRGLHRQVLKGVWIVWLKQ